jgi:hypothetical protein
LSDRPDRERVDLSYKLCHCVTAARVDEVVVDRSGGRYRYVSLCVGGLGRSMVIPASYCASCCATIEIMFVAIAFE